MLPRRRDEHTTIADLERRLAAAQAALSEKAGIEAALRRSEECRRIAVEGGRVGTWHSNLWEQVIAGDAAFMGVWGFPPTDGPHPYSQFLERMSPQGRDLMAEMIASTPMAREVFDGALKRLERNGLIRRKVLPTQPTGVEYTITPLGASLREPFAALYNWSLANGGELEWAQASYDMARERDEPDGASQFTSRRRSAETSSAASADR